MGDRGIVFLFNPNATAIFGEFALTAEALGLKADGAMSIAQEYPASDLVRAAQVGETIRWEVPAQSAVVLRIRPVEK